MKTQYDVIIVGAGAAGLMCAIEAGKRGRKVWLIDHAAKLAELAEEMQLTVPWDSPA